MSASMLETKEGIQYTKVVNHSMEATSKQLVKLHKWNGALKLVQEALTRLFDGAAANTSPAFLMGNAMIHLSSSGLLTDLPVSAAGYKLNEYAEWVADRFRFSSTHRYVTLSGNDINLTDTGTLNIQGLGDTGMTVHDFSTVEKVELRQDNDRIAVRLHQRIAIV